MYFFLFWAQILFVNRNIFLFRLLQDSANIRHFSNPKYIMGAGVRYEGSLTQPPCTQNVVWTVYPRPITLSHTQVSYVCQ